MTITTGRPSSADGQPRSAEAAAGAGREEPRTGEGVAGRVAGESAGGAGLLALLGAGEEALVAAVGEAECTVGLGDGEVAIALESLDRLMLHLERVLLALVTEADLRALATASGLSPRDWLASRCPWIGPHQLSDAIVVAEGLAQPDHEPVREAIAAGTLPLRRAARTLRALGKIRAVVPPELYAQDVDLLLRVATRPSHTDRDLTMVTNRLISAALPDKDLDAADRSARELRAVNESSLARGALTRFVIICEPRGAALLRAVMTSPLATPAPDAEGPDPRTATQRRYDALITILERGTGAPKEAPGTAKAKMVVTVSLDALTGLLTGAGHTLTGDQLAPHAVRTLACSADLIPMILGKDGETIETITPTRYTPESKLLALYRRDRGCSFPGCSIPPHWCDAHHVTWHSRGGKTALLNLALLCARHHTIVHQRDLTATITAHGATWHL